MNLDLTRELEPSHSEDDSEFKFATPLPPWDDDEGEEDASTSQSKLWNRYGAVYVRLLCAQRLPCPVGSSVVGAASLPPYSGRIKTARKSAFLSTYEHGVCVKWDGDGLCSMVNRWNNEKSPVPSIQISLLFSPLGMGILDFTMCTLTLSCAVLMKSPGMWKSQWCQATMTESAIGDNNASQPLIKLEATFVPTSVDGKPLENPMFSPVRKQKQMVMLSPPRNKNIQTSAVSSPARIAMADVTGIGSPKRLNAPNLENSSIEAKDNENDDTSSVVVATDENTPHLLRITTLYVPASCFVCSKFLVGRKAGYHCEACNTLCCEDCRLNVDLEIPCGSQMARDIVESSIRSKLNLKYVMSVVAPDEVYANRVDKSEVSGIGSLKIEFKRAVVFEEPFQADENPEIVFTTSRPPVEGEYYARITSSMDGKTARTQSVVSGYPHFHSKQMELLVSHYGEEFRLDVVDARTDLVVGTALLSTQGILQMQRDALISKQGASIFQIFRGPIIERKMCPPLKLVLRRGVNKAFGLEYYVPPRELDGGSRGTDGEKCTAIGWLEIQVGLEEFLYRLYHPRRPIECPERPPDDFNTALFQVHIMRAKAIFNEISDFMDLYYYVVSWRDPLLTAGSFVVLVWLCLHFDTEYIGCLPVFALAVTMAYFSYRINRTGRKEQFIRREIEAKRKAGNISVNYVLHRPLGTVTVSVGRGKALLSRDLGIPGKVYCMIFYDPLRFASSEARSIITEQDEASKSIHNIGRTAAIMSSEPEWKDSHYPSVENMRLSQLLRHADEFYTAGKQDQSLPMLSFPILQPFELKGRRRDQTGRFLDGLLKGWEHSKGAIVFQIQHAIGFDQVLGEVVVPISQLVRQGEISGWFQVLEPGSKTLAPVLDHEGTGTDKPRIHLVISWNPPKDPDGNEDTQREVSHGIQEELVRASRISKESQFNLVGSSIGAVNTALGLGNNIQFVQNTLGALLDSVESACNLFNFTDPFKSSIVFIALSALSLALFFMPTRYMVLLAVLGQYTSTLWDRYGESIFGKSSTSADRRTRETKDKTDEWFDPEFPSKWFVNMIRSLPTNEDLRRAYFWETRRLGAKENEKFASEKRVARLERLWKARWHASVEVRSNDEKDQSQSNWKSVFAVLEGRRFIFWDSVGAFDSGGLATGYLVLAGHAGITTISPIEAREIPEESMLERAVTIFGRGANEQQRLTVVLPDLMAKESLEAAVAEITSKDD